MKRLSPSGLAAALVILSLTMVGCAKKEKEQIALLQDQCNGLSNQNTELRAELAQAKTREGELEAQIEAKNLEIERKNQQIADLKAKQADATGRTGAGWDVGKFADRITVGSDILFASGSARLTAAGRRALDKIAADLKRSYPGMPVRVYGYTDSDPIKRTKKLWQDNLDLSANRAMAVTRYLVGKGIEAEAIETVAMGATHFVAENNTRTNKAKNRRVEIVVIKK